MKALLPTVGSSFALNCLLLVRYIHLDPSSFISGRLHLPDEGVSRQPGWQTLVLLPPPPANLTHSELLCLSPSAGLSHPQNRNSRSGVEESHYFLIIFKDSQTPSLRSGLASADMALIQKGAWLVPYIVSGPFACAIQFVILFQFVRRLISLDRTLHLLLCPRNCLLTDALAPPQLSHPQNETLDCFSHGQPHKPCQ